ACAATFALGVSPSAAQETALRASCQVPAASAAISHEVAVDYPELAWMQEASGTTLVAIDLSPTGTVVTARIARSSGSPLLDRAALVGVRQQTFAPQIVDCRTIGGTYLVAFDFPDPV
ncbi:MAG: energy transducer TonB, partial [Vulcanimicrobiaceae bacterium]